MGSRTPDGNDGVLVEILKDLRRRVTTLETPSGTSVRGLVDQVKAALANINATVTAAISANSYTKTEINTRIANPPAGSAVTGNVSSTGAVSASGAVSGATGTFPSGLSCLSARTNVLASGYAGSWIDSNGQFGISPSSIRYKMDVKLWQTDISRLLNLRSVTFRYRAEIDSDPKRPRQLGFIAEEVIQAGFPEFVFYDEEGEVQGLNYDRMVVALLELDKYQDERIVTLETATDALRDELEAIRDRLTAAGI